MADDQSIPSEQVIDLWPEGPPTALPPNPPESYMKTSLSVGGPEIGILRNVSEASLTVFRPELARANGVGVIVCPGGGWRILAWEHEGVDLCRWLTERGYAAFLLKYRLSATPEDPAEFARASAETAALLARPTPAAKTPRSLDPYMTAEMKAARETAADDGRRALALVRGRADEFGLLAAKVGLIGFSAGAFLVADVAMSPGGAPPAFVAPIYGGETRARPVPADAPPLFTAVAQDDRMLVSVVRGLVDDWFDGDRPVECHLFPRGGHGFGMIQSGAPTDAWIELFGAWLKAIGLA